MRAIIVGGGIAGLAAALALSGRGWQVEVLEHAPEFTEIGAGLALWPNGLRALDALGVGEHVRSRAVLEGQAGIRDAAGAVAVSHRHRRAGTPLWGDRHDPPRRPARGAVRGRAGRVATARGHRERGFGPMDRWCTRAVSPELTWSSVRTGAQRGAPVGVAWHPRATVRRVRGLAGGHPGGAGR
jgi:hypothetical protein